MPRTHSKSFRLPLRGLLLSCPLVGCVAAPTATPPAQKPSAQGSGAGAAPGASQAQPAATSSSRPSSAASPAGASRTFDAAAAISGLRPPKACLARVGYDGPYETCGVETVANGRALMLTIVTECGGDSCSVEAWLLPDATRAEHLSAYEGGIIAFAPDLSFYVTDLREFTSSDDFYQNFTVRVPQLVRIDLVTKKSQPFADCMSPVLSPDDEHFLCRNRYADVLRVPVDGGELELLMSNPRPEPVHWSPYSFTYPPPVSFVSLREIEVNWFNSLAPIRLPYSVETMSTANATPPATPRPLTDRLAACDAQEPFDIATICPPHEARGFPALAADGSVLFAIESWSSCCADMARDTLLEFSPPATGAAAAPKRTLLWEFDQETGKRTLSDATSRQRITALNQRATQLGARPLIPIPATGLSLGNDEILIASGPAARLLRGGRLVHVVERAPFEQTGFCCNAEPTQPGQEPATCTRVAKLKAAWWAPAARLLVTESEHNEGADGCELGPRIDVTRFPAPGQSSTLRSFELTE